MLCLTKLQLEAKEGHSDRMHVGSACLRGLGFLQLCLQRVDPLALHLIHLCKARDMNQVSFLICCRCMHLQQTQLGQMRSMACSYSTLP